MKAKATLERINNVVEPNEESKQYQIYDAIIWS